MQGAIRLHRYVIKFTGEREFAGGRTAYSATPVVPPMGMSHYEDTCVDCECDTFLFTAYYIRLVLQHINQLLDKMTVVSTRKRSTDKR